jgi:polyisoprenoid-binding protein YceI
MKRRNLAGHLGILALVCLVTAPAAAATYDVDVSHSSVGFSVRHMGVSNVKGAFGEFSGSFDFDPADLKSWKVEATMQVGSIDTRIENRDNHLKSPDFFDAENHPTITFRSTGVKPLEGGRHQLMGDLTIRGVTKPIVLDLELLGTTTDMRGNELVGFTATGTINRQDFGLSWSKVLETGGLVVGNEVKLMIEIEGIRRK